MKFLQSNRVLIIHPFLWLFAIAVIIVAKLLLCGYADIEKAEAYEQGKVDLVISLPIESLSEIAVKNERGI